MPAVAMTVAATHHQVCTKLLASSMICVGSGICMCESSKRAAKRGTTKVSRMMMEARPTRHSRAG